MKVIIHRDELYPDGEWGAWEAIIHSGGRRVMLYGPTRAEVMTAAAERVDKIRAAVPAVPVADEVVDL